MIEVVVAHEDFIEGLFILRNEAKNLLSPDLHACFDKFLLLADKYVAHRMPIEGFRSVVVAEHNRSSISTISFPPEEDLERLALICEALKNEALKASAESLTRGL